MAGRYDYTHAERKEKILRFFRQLLFWGVSLLAVIFFAWALVHFSLEKTNVADASMEPTLSVEDEILINTLVYRLRSPRRFEVIVFEQGDAEHSYYNIKRVIGLPGERVQIRDGKVYIDGEELAELVDVDTMLLPGLANYELTLGEDEYFVLGDARNNSEDSRYATIGNVKREEIVGKAWIRLNKFGFVNQMNRKDE